jgi:threonine synthase
MKEEARQAPAGTAAPKLTVLGATSGDTGSAALEGVRGKDGIEAFILFPHGRVSEVQQRQMTTILDQNIHCMAVEGGSFDDCQDAVKELFRDAEFKAKHRLAAVNSINWARIVAQVVYYFKAYYLSPEARASGYTAKVSFTVPTGNFGNVLAGWYAAQMGLPVDALVLATNCNDILHRFFKSGVYERRAVTPTMSPSMDIAIASNFERFLYHLHGNDSEAVRALMDRFAASGSFSVPAEALARAGVMIRTAAVSEEDTARTVRDFAVREGYVACPHTAIGLCAASAHAKPGVPMISLATAHAGKFGDAVRRCLGEDRAGLFDLPEELKRLLSLETRVLVVPKDAARIGSIVAAVVARGPGHEALLGDSTFGIKVPSSSANLGPGFDVLGLALGLHLRLTVRRSPTPGAPLVIEAFEGEGAGSVALDDTNLVVVTARAVAAKHGVASLPGASVRVLNEIPLARGLGSSSTAIVAGVMLADRLCGLGLSRAAIFQHAAEAEGHPDNVAAAVYGGCVASCVFESGQAFAVPVPVSGSVHTVVVVPNYELSTALARSVLPKEYPRADCVYNLSRAVCLAGALGTASEASSAAIRELMSDRLHQPQRAHLMPGFLEALNSCRATKGCLGVSLSGAGSSILALALRSANTDDIAGNIISAVQSAGKDARAFTLPIDNQGAVFY